MVPEPDFEKPVGRVVWKRTLWAVGRNRGHFEWRGGRLALAQRNGQGARTSVNTVGTQKVFSEKMEGGGEEENQCLTTRVFEKENA